jgi:hypothetical protein
MGGSYRVVDKAAYFGLIGYEPHPKQWLYHHSQARFRIPCCGRRFGKSWMAARDREPELLVPNRMAWIVGPTYDLGEKEFRVLWRDMIIRLHLGKQKGVRKAYNKKQGDMYIEFPWQTRVEVRSAEHADNLVGEKLHWVIMSEAARHKKDTFEHYIRAALADERGSADFPSTPVGQNWYHNIWQWGKDPNYPEYESWRFPSWENPYVYPKGSRDPEIALIKRTTIPEWFDQEIAADFTAFVGKIYPQWDENKHVQPHKFRPDWPNYVCFDWGYVNPMAAIEFQISPDDTIHVWREWYKPYTRLEQAIRELKQRPQPEGYHVTMCFGDAADPEAAATVNKYFGPCLAEPDAKKNWREGVELVQMFLIDREFPDLTDTETEAELDSADSLANYGFYVDPSCNNTIREFNNYRAPYSSRDINLREAAQKYDDHALDAIRYGLMHLYRLGAQHHLNETILDGPISSSYVERDGLLIPTSATTVGRNESVTTLPVSTLFQLSDLGENSASGEGGFFTMNGESF